jgi:hypothetical protein
MPANEMVRRLIALREQEDRGHEMLFFPRTKRSISAVGEDDCELS